MLKSSFCIFQLTNQCKNVMCRNLVTSSSPQASWIFSKVCKFYHYQMHSTLKWKIHFLKKKDASKSTGHSSLLSDRNEVYEVRVEDVSPANWEEYLKRKGKMKLVYSLHFKKIKSLHITFLTNICSRLHVSPGLQDRCMSVDRGLEVYIWRCQFSSHVLAQISRGNLV